MKEIAAVGEAMPLSPKMFAVDAYAQWKDVIEADPSLMYDQSLERFRSGAAVSGVDYLQAWMKLRKLRKVWQDETAAFDGIIMPTSPILPPKVDRLISDHDYYVTENLMALRNTRIGNLMGACGLSLPSGAPSARVTTMVGAFTR